MKKRNIQFTCELVLPVVEVVADNVLLELLEHLPTLPHLRQETLGDLVQREQTFLHWKVSVILGEFLQSSRQPPTGCEILADHINLRVSLSINEL